MPWVQRAVRWELVASRRRARAWKDLASKLHEDVRVLQEVVRGRNDELCKLSAQLERERRKADQLAQEGPRAKNDKDAWVLQEVVRAKNDKVCKLSADLDGERRRAARVELAASAKIGELQKDVRALQEVVRGAQLERERSRADLGAGRVDLAASVKIGELQKDVWALQEVVRGKNEELCKLSAQLERERSRADLGAGRVDLAASIAEVRAERTLREELAEAERTSRCHQSAALEALKAAESLEFSTGQSFLAAVESMARCHGLATKSAHMAACGECQSDNALNFLAAVESFAESNRLAEKSAGMALAAHRVSCALVDSCRAWAALSTPAKQAPPFGTSSAPKTASPFD
jgi:hypothetical protein